MVTTRSSQLGLALLGLALAGCMPSQKVDPLGFKCQSDAECDSTTLCIGHICRVPWPSAANTGVPPGTALTPSGPLTLTQPGAILEGLDVNGCVDIKANNVTLRRSRLMCDTAVVTVEDGVTGTVLEDVEIHGAPAGAGQGVIGSHLTLTRANIHGVGKGGEFGNGTVIQDSWFHDLLAGGAPAIGTGGSDGLTVRHNRISQTSPGVGDCILGGSAYGPFTNVLIQDNLFNGGGYSVHLGLGNYPFGTVKLRDNRYGRDFAYGPFVCESCTVDQSGDVFDDTGLPIQ